MSRKLPEILTGLVVLAVAAIFLYYALDRVQALGGSGYPLKAQFADVGGLEVGADVKIGGVTVGHVTSEVLNPQTFAAVVGLSIDNDVKLPTDSSATISSDGLLGGNYVGIAPGGSPNNMQPGSSFQVTQSAINIENLLGQFIFNMGGKTGGAAGQKSAAGTPGAPASAATPTTASAPGSTGASAPASGSAAGK